MRPRTATTRFLLDGAPAQALTFHAVPQRGDGAGGLRDHKAAESIEVAATLCARAIRDALQAAGEGRALRRDSNGAPRALEPRDCAVLVRRHNEAQAVRDALAALGVPAVATGRQSLFSSAAAQELLTLLLALIAPGDERRLRATLALPLFGLDASALRALEDDGEQLRRWQLQFEHWRLRWQQHGPQAMLADVVAQRAAQVLALHDGERRLTHLLQLGELMQEASAAHLGPHSQLDWLRAAIDSADDADEAQWPRLESDASRVQILTLHKSKGLEFPLVFLPFVGIGRGGNGSSGFVSYHDGNDVRVRQWQTELTHDALPWKAASQLAAQEEREEDMRLLYVGLTRAIDALWVCGGALASHDKSALSRLLGGNAPGAALRQALDGVLRVSDGLPEPADNVRVRLQDAAPAPPARAPERRLLRDWWIHSFSQLHRQRPHGVAALVEESPASDERAAVVLPVAPRVFAGERFGNTLHHALEHIDFAAWRDHRGDVPPPGEDRPLHQALHSQGYREADWAAGVRELVPLIAGTLNAALPTRSGEPDVRLCALPPAQRVAELEFHFVLDAADSRALLALLHAHGLVRERRDFGVWPRLSGLMTGKIDLTYRVGARAYVVDYKSNFLPGYDHAQLAQSMAAHEYDLQALLYAVAVHRWLQRRLGAALRLRDAFRRRALPVLPWPRSGSAGTRGGDTGAAARAGRRHGRTAGPRSADMSATQGMPAADERAAPRAIDLALADVLRRQERAHGVASDERVLLATALASLAISEGHAAFDPAQPQLLLDDGRDWPAAGDWREALSQSPWVATPDADAIADASRPLVLEHGLLYLRRYREYERRLAAGLLRLARQAVVTGDLAALAPLFLQLFPQAREHDTPGDGGQARAAALALVRSLLLITGGPGTGKTTTIARLLVLLTAQLRNLDDATPARIALAAPTGRAAERMAQSLREAVAQLRALGCRSVVVRCAAAGGAHAASPARSDGRRPALPPRSRQSAALRRDRGGRSLDGRPAADVQAGRSGARRCAADPARRSRPAALGRSRRRTRGDRGCRGRGRCTAAERWRRCSANRVRTRRHQPTRPVRCRWPCRSAPQLPTQRRCRCCRATARSCAVATGSPMRSTSPRWRRRCAPATPGRRWHCCATTACAACSFMTG